MRRRHLSVLAGLTAGMVLVGSAVLAGTSPSPEAISKNPPVLTDQSWANRVPAAAPEIKKIQQLFAEDPTRGRLAAASALSSPFPVVRTYAALVLGAVGQGEQLEPIATQLTQESDATVQPELELAQARIRLRLAGGHDEKQVAVLAAALQSKHSPVRLWAAQSLKANPAKAARELAAQALLTEQDPAVRAELQGQ
jgi:hypothetical protein